MSKRKIEECALCGSACTGTCRTCQPCDACDEMKQGKCLPCTYEMRRSGKMACAYNPESMRQEAEVPPPSPPCTACNTKPRNVCFRCALTMRRSGKMACVYQQAQIPIIQDDLTKQDQQVYQERTWELPITRPVARAGSYIQPIPVSGFPYANTARLDLFLGVPFLYEHTLDQAITETRELFTWTDHAFRQGYLERMNWRDKNFDTLCMLPPTEYKRVADLLFRVPFLQEQPWLRTLMVHPTANRAKFQSTVVPAMIQCTGHRLHPDVMNIVLAFAYSDALNV